MRIVIASGGFDPLHEGHIYYLQAAKRLGDKLIVGLNSDRWLKRKKGFAFQSEVCRYTILKHLDMVDVAMLFDDKNDSASELIRAVQLFNGRNHEYIFANGGDRTVDNIPEMSVQYEYPVEFVFGVGGENKANSSSDLVRKVKEHESQNRRLQEGQQQAEDKDSH